MYVCLVIFLLCWFMFILLMTYHFLIMHFTNNLVGEGSC